jgi:hypothetical protein
MRTETCSLNHKKEKGIGSGVFHPSFYREDGAYKIKIV